MTSRQAERGRDAGSNPSAERLSHPVFHAWVHLTHCPKVSFTYVLIPPPRLVMELVGLGFCVLHTNMVLLEQMV